ncbi:hypothetical protein EXIGLDRAFT_736073 [Exidia glandulosa HHB12029]|uniref:Uncharacterized protein n=1 Tax=Exidia glandulosa HHB12029 TaxID=1314781 RepID=A0A165JL62_EXIGL|nr:hypothetical protein EXIGLDRAFT_736073 [Exidia glandulosa HHB12029]
MTFCGLLTLTSPSLPMLPKSRLRSTRPQSSRIGSRLMPWMGDSLSMILAISCASTRSSTIHGNAMHGLWSPLNSTRRGAEPANKGEPEVARGRCRRSVCCA